MATKTKIRARLATAHAAQLAAKDARIAELEEDAADSYRLTGRLGDLLTKTVNVLRGNPPELTSWSWHDIPELARRMDDRRKALRDALELVEDHKAGFLSEAAREALAADDKAAT